MNRAGIFRSPLIVAYALWICAIVPVSHAGLSWDSHEVTAPPVPGASAVTGEFHFRNTEATAVTIASVHPACGCTTVKLEKTRYAPGEMGVLTVTFTIGDRTGAQQKTIEVQEEGAKAPDVLTLSVPLPEPMKVSSSTLEWKIGDTPATKDIQVSTNSGVHFDRVESTSTEFEIHSAPAAHGEVTVKVRPLVCDNPTTALLRVYFSGSSSGAVLVPLRVGK